MSYLPIEQHGVIGVFQRGDFALYRLNGGIAVAPVFFATLDAVTPRLLLHEVNQIGGIGEGVSRRLDDGHWDRLMRTFTVIAAVNRERINPLIVLVRGIAVWFRLHE